MLPVVIVRSQSKLLLKVMSESVDMHCHGLVLMSLAHFTTRKYGDVPGWGSSRRSPGYPEDVQNWTCPSLDVALWRADLIFHLWQHSGEQVLHLTQAAQQS